MTDKKTHHLLLFGCALPTALLIAFFIGLAVWKITKKQEKKPPEYIKQAENKIKERTAKIAKRLKKPITKQDYDPDQTVMALYSIEKALSEAKNFEELTPFILQKESSLVAPDVAKFKYDFFNVYKKMLNAQDDLEDAESLYKTTRDALTEIAGMVGYDPVTGVSFDKEQAQRVWQEHIAKSKVEKEIKERLYAQQDSMMRLLFELGKLKMKYIPEWNRLCTMRDRAYLATYENDIDEAIDSASAAVKAAPHEKEAHILLAAALIKRNHETDADGAIEIINKALKEGDAMQAPLYLLRGVIKMNKGDLKDAGIDFDQAAAYYPKQQEVLTNRLNLYRKRSFLNKSKEGRIIIGTYRGIMTGSGFFSPDFQQARIFIKKGESQKAEKKIFDHFFRRRLQGQWDRVLTDFRFCKDYLPEDFKKIFDSRGLNLKIEPSWFANKLIVEITNTGATPVHNLTLLLCVRFTDMFKGDYITFRVGDSVAVITPGETVQVGKRSISQITKEKLGTEKKWKDIINYGAIAVSDEAITWVTPATKPSTTSKIKEDPHNK